MTFAFTSREFQPTHHLEFRYVAAHFTYVWLLWLLHVWLLLSYDTYSKCRIYERIFIPFW